MGDLTPADKMADDREVVELHSVECRQCPYKTVTSENKALVYDQWFEHHGEAGHRNGWKFTAQRGRLRTGL